jgi:hypothetical protein
VVLLLVVAMAVVKAVVMMTLCGHLHSAKR